MNNINRHKVLFVTDSLGNGGLERQLTLLVKYLPGNWDCKVWSMSDGPYAQKIRSLGRRVEVRPRTWRFDITPAFHLWCSLYAWRPDVVHSWGWMSSLAAIPACKCLRIPIVDGTIRTGITGSRSLLLPRLSMCLADRVVANSRAGLKAWHVQAERGTVIYNGFDSDRLVQCSHQRSCRTPFTAVMTGRMNVLAKDYRTFFAAARHLMKAGATDFHFVAVGNGPDRENVIREAGDLVNAGLVSFPEAELEVLSIVSQADVGVLLTSATAGEGCSNSIMEYMACGLPVVCNDDGGNRELVLDGQTGFLIQRGDVKALVKKLILLRQNPREAERLGEAGRQRLLKQFSTQALVNETVLVYNQLIRRLTRTTSSLKPHTGA